MMRASGVETAYSVRPMAATDVAAAFGLASCTPEAARWSQADYSRAAGGDWDGWVAAGELQQRGNLVGFLIARRMADEMEILNLAVEPAERRRGVAGRLLEAALERGRACGVKRIFLEVRASNAGAIAFYEHGGFVRTGRRPRYYTEPLEDGWVLSRKLVEASA